MTARRKRKFVRSTCREPFPVIANAHLHREQDTGGPYYAPGAEWFEPFSDASFEAAQRRAAYWAGHGYTFIVDVVTR